MGRTRADVRAVAAILVGTAGGVVGTAWALNGLGGEGPTGLELRCVSPQAGGFVYSAREGNARVAIRPAAPIAPAAGAEPCDRRVVRTLTVVRPTSGGLGVVRVSEGGLRTWEADWRIAAERARVEVERARTDAERLRVRMERTPERRRRDTDAVRPGAATGG